jgi:hypothetical protein
MIELPAGRNVRLIDPVAAPTQASTGLIKLTFALYLAIILLDALRKTIGLPGSSIAIIYVIAAILYAASLMARQRQRNLLPSFLPMTLLFITAWCVLNAIVRHVPASLAVLGWSSYVFFVPLAYVGAKLMADDRSAVRVLRVAAVIGSLVGIGTIASAILGPSAPTLLQPIVPGVGYHTANGGNIYLAPSIFADSEEACEQLLVALFAWAALMLADHDSIKRGRLTALGLVIFAGIIAAERRAGIYIAIVGLIMLLAAGSGRSQTSPTHMRRQAFSGGGRWQLVLALSMTALGSVILINVLGANLILSFLTSSSLGAPLRLMIASAHPAALYGQGTGTSTQGSYILGATSFSGTNAQGPYTGVSLDGRSFITAEGGLSKTWLELGLIGVLLYGAVFITIIGPVLRSLGKLDSIGRALLAATIGLGILFLKGHQSLDDPLIQPLFWIAAGGVWGRLRRSSTVADNDDLLTPISAGFECRPLSAGSL